MKKTVNEAYPKRNFPSKNNGGKSKRYIKAYVKRLTSASDAAQPNDAAADQLLGLKHDDATLLLRLNLLLRLHLLLSGPLAADTRLARKQISAKRQKKQADHIDQHKCTASVLPRHPWEFPYISTSDRAARA
jgi:hypothetical protein